MGKSKLTKEARRFCERELYQYWENKKRLNSLLDTQKNHINSRTIIYLQQRINNIEVVIKKLNTFEIDVFELIFKENMNWLCCKTEKNISKYTYYNVFNKCVELLAEEFGEI